MKPRFVKLLLWSLPVLLLAACAAPRDTISRPVSATGRLPEGPGSILFIGNSYSIDLPRELQRIAARNGRRLRIGQVTNSGWTLDQHTRNEETLNAIREGAWDIVVIQEQSRIPSQPFKRVLAMFPAVRLLADEARAHGATPVLYQTWGYRDGDPYHSAGDDFHAMNARVREGYQAAARHAGILKVVPVGDVWEREMQAGRGAKLFFEDGSHPSPTGVNLAAQTFYQALFSSP